MTQITLHIARVGRPFMEPNINIDDSKTVRRLKQDISALRRVNVDEQILVFYKQVLDDRRTLESYGITNESKVQLSAYFGEFRDLSTSDSSDLLASYSSARTDPHLILDQQ